MSSNERVYGCQNQASGCQRAVSVLVQISGEEPSKCMKLLMNECSALVKDMEEGFGTEE